MAGVLFLLTVISGASRIVNSEAGDLTGMRMGFVVFNASLVVHVISDIYYKGISMIGGITILICGLIAFFTYCYQKPFRLLTKQFWINIFKK